MTARQSVKVTVLNEDITIRSDSPPEHTKAVARYLDDAVRQIMASGAVVEHNRAVVLAALRITAELFDERKASEQITASMQELADELRPLLPPAKRASRA